MRKIFGMLAALLIVLALLLLVLIQPINDLTAASVAADLRDIPLPADTTLVESCAAVGKLVGSGNGMQYFGCLLLESALSLDALQQHYDGIAEVQPQTGRTVALLEHHPLRFSAPLGSDGRYYLVYAWGEGIPLFAALDLRGH